MPSEITIRRATDDDIDAIIEVAGTALGWAPGEPHADLFRWKHLENPFGVSPMWVAEADGRLAGFRALMRWELIDADGTTVTAVRAVDTATHPDFQRRGIFSKLTMAGIDAMATEGVDIVFNTPNSQSRPGYLKLGWIDVGRLPVAFRPTGTKAAIKVLKARTAAEKWSEPTDVGEPAADVLVDAGLEQLLTGQPRPDGLSTKNSLALLRWRYRLEPMHYRAWVPDGIDGGVVLFRVRRRGQAAECTIGTVLAPKADPARKRSLLATLAKASVADYLLKLGPADARGGFMPALGLGPRLTARAVSSEPDPDISHWRFELGDIELF
ncbi:MAG: GNAT family N-acetyltransferase [Acidimicrobiales bacterium]